MCAALEASSANQNGSDGGSEALITYMQNHCSPEVELFSASMLNEWMVSPEKVVELSDLCTKSLQSRGTSITSETSLMYLSHVIQNATSDIVKKDYRKWSACIAQSITGGQELWCSQTVLKSFLEVIRRCPEASREFSTSQLPTLLQTLLSYRRLTTSSITSRSIIACLSVCVYHYPSAISQHQMVLYSWAIEGLASADSVLSGECSRLLALITLSDASSWEKSVQRLCNELKLLIATALTPYNQTINTSFNGSMFPPLPTSEPERIASTCLRYQSVARTLAYQLSFKMDAPVNVPLQLLMSVICEPFTLVPDRLAGRYALELLLLQCALPLFYSTVFILLEALIKCVAAHLLPYSVVINQLFVHTLNWTDHRNSKYQDLCCLVYRCITTWLLVNKCYISCDHLVSMVIADSEVLKEENSSSDMTMEPKKKKRKQANRISTTSTTCNVTRSVNHRLVLASLTAVKHLLQFCGPVLTVTLLEDLEQHYVKSLSHSNHSSSILMELLQCLYHLINVSCYQYTPPVSWVIAIITNASHSDNSKVRLTALQLMSQCDMTVLSSSVSHLPTPVTRLLPTAQTLTTIVEKSHHLSPTSVTEQKDSSGSGPSELYQFDVGEEVIMIDDVSSNDGASSTVAKGDDDVMDVRTVISVDSHGSRKSSHSGSHDSHSGSHVDVQGDGASDDVNAVMDKFVDQSSDDDSLSAE